MYVQRQIAANLGRGQQTSIAKCSLFPWRLRDVAPGRKALSVGDGEVSTGFHAISSASYTIPLPNEYTNASRLYVAIKTEGTVKVTVVSPDHGTSTFLVKGTWDTTDGLHPGLLVLVGTVTSIAVVANAGVTTPVEWFLHKLPDLTAAASYQQGQLALGVSS